MRRVRAWGLTPRVVVVVASALALIVLGSYLTHVSHPTSYGWYAYAPLNSNPSAPEVGPRPWARALVWFGLFIVWVVPSAWLLRPARKGASSSGWPDGPSEPLG